MRSNKNREPAPTIMRITERISRGEAPQFSIGAGGVMRRHDRICVPVDAELRQRILQEAHCTPYSVQPGASKMYHDVRRSYWWGGKKPDVARFMA